MPTREELLRKGGTVIPAQPDARPSGMSREQLIAKGGQPRQGQFLAAPEAPPVRTADLPDKARSAASFLPREVADIFTGATQAFGRTLGKAGAAIGGTLGRIDESAVQEAEANFQLAKLLNRTGDPEQRRKIREQLGVGSRVGTSAEQVGLPGTRQIIGQAIGTGLEAMTGSLAKKAAVGFRAAATVKAGAKAGAKAGGLVGGAAGASQALREDADLADVALRTAGGAAGGAALGGGLGGLQAKAGQQAGQRATQKAITEGGDISRRLQAKTAEADDALAGLRARPAEAAEEAVSRAPVPKAVRETSPADVRIAKVRAAPGGGIRKDRVAIAAIRKGVPDSHVAMMKTADPTNRGKMTKMLDIREAQKNNVLTKARAGDVIGESFLDDFAKPMHRLNRQAGKDIDRAAKGLKGRQADFNDPVEAFLERIGSSGITIDGEGALNFVGSDFEGLPAERAIRTVWQRALKLADDGDALEGHRLKRFIDENVSYGKVQEGLKGRAEAMLKSLRRGVDFTLDESFGEYARANAAYSDTINQMDRFGKLFGKDFDLFDEELATKVGTSFRGFLSNNRGRADLIRMMDESEEILALYGQQVGNDLPRQIIFADFLESVFGSEAPTSFLGAQEKAQRSTVGAGVQAGQDILTGHPVRGLAGLVGKGADALRGVDTDEVIAAIRALLK